MGSGCGGVRGTTITGVMVMGTSPGVPCGSMTTGGVPEYHGHHTISFDNSCTSCCSWFVALFDRQSLFFSGGGIRNDPALSVNSHTLLCGSHAFLSLFRAAEFFRAADPLLFSTP